MKSSKEKFIELVKKAELIQFNYPHWNDVAFYPGHVFNYWYEGVRFDDNEECLKLIQEEIIVYCNELGDKKFEEGGWSALIDLPADGAYKGMFHFQVNGGPGSNPPCCQ